MAQNREISGKPLVSLDAGKLLGLRQVAEVSGGAPGMASRSRVRTSQLLSKVGGDETPDARAVIGASGSRVQMGRLLSKISAEDPV